MNKLPLAKRIRVVSALVEGNSIRATCRMTDVAKGTVTKLLVELGTACEEYQREVLVNLPCRRVQCDEIWSFVGCKAKNVEKTTLRGGWLGDAWTWTATDAEFKLVLSWLVGGRDAGFAEVFIRDVANRLENRVQLTTVGGHEKLSVSDHVGV